MKTIIKFETRELKPRPDLTVYNHIHYDIIRRNNMDLTHLIEKYDDVNECPTFELGYFDGNGKFVCKLYGEGDNGIPENSFTCGGIWVEIELC